MELCASVLAANHAHIGRDMAAAERSGIKRFHFDIVDGYYASNIAFGPQLIDDVRSETNSYLDAHLAVSNIPKMLDLFLECGANLIDLQFEACDNPAAMIKVIHDHGLAAGLCLALESDVDTVEALFPELDVLNLLAVNPGIGGQNLRSSVLKKIERAVSVVHKLGSKTLISVDGGINRDTISDVMSAGADIAIIGSGIFKGDIEENISRLRDIVG